MSKQGNQVFRAGFRAREAPAEVRYEIREPAGCLGGLTAEGSHGEVQESLEDERQEHRQGGRVQWVNCVQLLQRT